MFELQQVYEGENPLDAHLVASMLQANGLHPQVVHDQLWSVAVEVLTTPGVLPAVQVPAVEADTARQLIQEWRSLPKAQGKPWTCPQCGAENDAQFGQCWRCGYRLEPRSES